MLLASALLWSFAAYTIFGVSVGVAFLVWGLGVVDPSARGARWSFRILILPGLAALWPWVILRWRRAFRHAPHHPASEHA